MRRVQAIAGNCIQSADNVTLAANISTRGCSPKRSNWQGGNDLKLDVTWRKLTIDEYKRRLIVHLLTKYPLGPP